MTRSAPANDETTRRPETASALDGDVDARVRLLTVLAHPDPRRVGERAALPVLDLGRAVELSRASPRFAPLGASWDERPLDDAYLSRKPWTLRPDGEGLELIRGDSSITLRLDGQPLAERASVPADALDRGVTVELSGRVALLLHRLPVAAFEAAEAAPRPSAMVGASDGLMRVWSALSRVADLDVPVLVRGESGTGKELVARELHERSRRADGPFVAVDLGVLTPALAAAELFGHAKGAFTGAAAARRGFFRAAEGGTLFLDEVGEATPEVQAMLLRALETRQVVPVGSHAPIAVDVRLVAATDSDLEARVRRGDFKEPLLHRLAAYVIEMPPLRERRDDLGRLLVHLARPVLRELGEEAVLDRPATSGPPWLPPELVARLARAPWTGNVRQLANVVRQLVIDSRGGPVLRPGSRIETLLDPPLPTPSSASALPSAEPEASTAPTHDRPPFRRRPSDIDDDEVEAALRACDFELAATAQRLGIRRPSVYNLVRRHPRLRLVDDLPEDEIRAMLAACDGDVAEAARRLEVSWRALGRRVARLGSG